MEVNESISNGAMLVLLLTLGLLPIICPLCSAQIFTYGSNYNYSEVVLPNNSYVHQGENISQGLCYDLSGVYGWSGILGNWKSEYDYGYTAPDNHNNLNDINYKVVCLDSSKWPVGAWYQIDRITSDTDDYTSDHGNNLAFRVVPYIGESAPSSTIEVVHTNISVQSGDEIVEIPVTYTMEVTAEPTHADIAAKNVTTITLPTTATPEPTRDPRSTPVPVTPKTPIDVVTPIIALGVILLHRK